MKSTAYELTHSLQAQGGGLYLFYNSKNIKDIFLINKTELVTFCQPIKVIGLTWAFLQPFLSLDLKNFKIE